MRKITTTLCFVLLAFFAKAQGNWNYAGQTNNFISTGMPILMISPDAISAAMGDAGVASTPDANSTHWNNAKFAFTQDKMSVTTTYTPWLRNLGVSDMNLLYLGGYRRLNDRSAVAASLTYFSLGEINSTGETGEDKGTFFPNEFAVDVTYAMKLGDNLSLGATGRYMRDDLTNGQDVEHQSTKAANALSADVGLYYQQTIDKNQSVAAGIHISNLGSKLRYSDDDTESEFLPANFRIGGRYTYLVDDYNKINFILDLNKLLVPTPPVKDEDGNYISKYYANMAEYNQTGSVQGAINSFFDAPGGLKEEISEFTVNAGAEYWYQETFAGRIGYFFEPSSKGGRQYLTLGFGLRYNIFTFDFSYLLPTTTIANNPLANTIRISIAANFANSKK